MNSTPNPATPKVEQPVPQEVLELVRRIQCPPWTVSGFVMSEAQAAALILAAMERFAEQKNAELVRELEDEKSKSAKAYNILEEHRQDYVKARDAFPQQLAALRRENETLREELKIMEHKVITCGVAAQHSDIDLTRRGAYAGKWDSPQAEAVRLLRSRAETLARENKELRKTKNPPDLGAFVGMD